MLDRKLINTFIPFIFFVSGFCSLVYEIIWMKKLSLVFGITIIAISSVLAVFMAGLAVGSFFFGRLVDRSSNPIIIYALLEIGIGFYALFTPLLIKGIAFVYFRFYPFFSFNEIILNIFRLSSTFVVLFVPTLLMGGTLPAVGKSFISENRFVGRRMGLLYFINTLGGAFGSFLAGFFLLGMLGVESTTILTGFVNITIGAVVILIFRLCSSSQSFLKEKIRDVKEEVSKFVYPKSVIWIILIVFLLSGFSGLSYEVLWSRLLVFVIGSHIYAFTIILTTFLTGLAVGGILFGRVADGKNRALVASFLQIIIGIFGIILIFIFYYLPSLFEKMATLVGESWLKLTIIEFIVCFAIMIFPTILMGGMFPLVVRSSTPEIKILGRRVGLSYMLNTFGSIGGSISSGFFLIPWIGIRNSILSIAFLNILAGSLLLYLLTSKFTRIFSLGIIGSLITFLVFFTPSYTVFQPIREGEKILYYKEGSAGTVSVIQKQNDYKVLTINGLEEVPSDYASLQTFRLLGHLPLLIHPSAKDVLVVSFGAGIATGAVAQYPVERITSVELCPEVVEAAASFFSLENNYVLKDPRLKLIIQDARNYLSTTKEKYDVITADATHPSSGDSWVLYTKEFYELCRNRLKDGGIMCQWLPLHWLSPMDYKILLKTFLSIFPHTTLWFTGSYTIMVGSNEKMAIDYSLLKQKMKQDKIIKDLQKVNIDSPFALLACFLMGEEKLTHFVEGSPINTDDKPYAEFSIYRSFGVETTSLNLANLLPHRENVSSLLVNLSPEEVDEVKENIARYFSAKSYIIKGRLYHFKGIFEKEINFYKKALEINPGDRDAVSFLSEARRDLKFFYLRKGDFWRKNKEFEKAVHYYNKAIEVDPHFAQAYNNRGIAYFSQGMISKAIEDYNTALRYAPYQGQIYYNLALAYIRIGQMEKVREYLEKFEKLRRNYKLKK